MLYQIRICLKSWPADSFLISYFGVFYGANHFILVRIIKLAILTLGIQGNHYEKSIEGIGYVSSSKKRFVHVFHVFSICLWNFIGTYCCFTRDLDA